MSAAEDLEFLKTLRDEFMVEAKETLDEFERTMMAYDKGQADMISYKRTLHSLKGSAHAVDLKDIAKVLHIMETECMDCKNNPHYSDLSLKRIDLIREWIGAMEDDNEDEASNIANTLLAMK